MGGHKKDVSGVPWLIRRVGNRIAKSPLGPTIRKMGNGRRMLPSFIVVGAMRSGTTFLHRTLARHPQVRDPWRKEIHYFDFKFDRGLDWYKAYFPFSEPGCITGESTPSYMFHPLAAARMMEVLPNVKVIAVLRDPTERAISHYRMLLSRNIEPLSFKEAIAQEESRIAEGRSRVQQNPDDPAPKYYKYSYRERGIYLPQIQRLKQHIPGGQLLILDAGRLFNAPDNVLAEVEAFLGIQAWTPDVYKPDAVARVDGNIDAETEAELREFFCPHNQALFAELGWEGGWK